MNRIALALATAMLLGNLDVPLAATWVVDPGSEETQRAATAAHVVRTIARAAELAVPGDVVRVKPGVYRETVLLPRSGRLGATIRFIAEPPGSVVITGADRLAGLIPTSGAEPIYEAPWRLRFIAGRDRSGRLIEHHPVSEPLWGRAEQVIADGRLLLPAPSLAALRAAWHERKRSLAQPVIGLGRSFAGMFAVEQGSGRLHLWLADGSDPRQQTIEASVRPLLVAPHPLRRGRGVEHVSFEGFVFRHAANFPQRAAVLLEGSHNLLADCVVEAMSGAGVSVHGTLRNCRVRHNGHVGGSAEGTGFLNEDTVWEGNSWKPIERAWEAGGVKITRDGPGEFRNCSFVRNGGPGLWFDVDAHDIVVSKSRFIENESSGVFIEISRDISIVDSVSIGNATGVIGGVRPGRWGSGGIAIAESLRARVKNNVVQGNLDGVSLREQGPRLVDRQDGGTIAYRNGGHEITNNQISGNDRYQLALWWDNSFFGPHPTSPSRPDDADHDPAQQHLLIDANRYKAPSGSTPFLYGAPWRPRSRRLNELHAFTRASGFEREGSLLFE